MSRAHHLWALPQDDPWSIPQAGPPFVWGANVLHKSHHAKWMRGILYCGHCCCHSIKGKSIRGLGSQCRANPRSKNAIATRRMIVTGKVRQVVKEWLMVVNKAGNELLGRCDMYPKPSGKESHKASGLLHDAPPTDAPQAPAMFPHPRAVRGEADKENQCKWGEQP